MATSELGACEWFVWELRKSNLIDRGQLDQLVGEYLKRFPRSEPPALAEHLVGQSILTPFQAERLLQGKSQVLVLGPYRLMDALGSGSMGAVYKALSKNDEKWYAVKVLPRRSMWNVRIARRQVRAFEQCKHPAVVPFVDVGTAGGMHYLAWPLVEGETLESLVQRQGKLSPGLAALVILQVAEGLDVTHKAGLIHGLVKPSNLMIGSDHQVRVLDYGIGSLLSETEGESLVDTMSTANTLTSGLDCTSPESIMEPTNRTPAGDQYSLGCVLYFCLTGQYPFPEGSAVEKMMAHQTKQPTPVQELASDVVPDGLAAVVERLMAKTPEARFGSMEEAVQALRPVASPARMAKWPALQLHRPEPVRLDNGPPAPSAPTQERASPLSRDIPGLPPTAPPRTAPLRRDEAPAPAPGPAPARPVSRSFSLADIDTRKAETSGEKPGSPLSMVLVAVLVAVITFFAARYFGLLP